MFLKNGNWNSSTVRTFSSSINKSKNHLIKLGIHKTSLSLSLSYIFIYFYNKYMYFLYLYIIGRKLFQLWSQRSVVYFQLVPIVKFVLWVFIYFKIKINNLFVIFPGKFKFPFFLIIASETNLNHFQ